MKDTTRKILAYLQKMDGVKDVTSYDIASATGIEMRSINGTLTSFSAQTPKRAPLGYREKVKTILKDGSTNTITYFRLNDLGRHFDLNG